MAHTFEIRRNLGYERTINLLAVLEAKIRRIRDI